MSRLELGKGGKAEVPQLLIHVHRLRASSCPWIPKMSLQMIFSSRAVNKYPQYRQSRYEYRQARVRRRASTASSTSYLQSFSSYESEPGIFELFLATRIGIVSVVLGVFDPALLLRLVSILSALVLMLKIGFF